MRIVDKKLVFSAIETVDFSSLGDVIHTWLVQFKAGYIACEHYSVPTELADEHGEKAQEKYIEILDKMIYAFADDEPVYAGEITMDVNESSLSGITRRSWPKVSDQDAWDRYIVESMEHDFKVQEGVALFGKYFRSLWV